MSVRFFVEHRGKRQAVTVTPMSPMKAVLQEACAQCKPPFDPTTCQLQYQKKAIDLGTPVRFANLPKDAKLELVPGQQQPLGLSDSAGASQVQGSSQEHEANMPDKHRSIAAAPSEARLPLGAQPSQTDASPASDQNPASQQLDQLSTDVGQPGQAQSTAGPVGDVPAGLDRHVHVFKREAIAAQASGARSDADLPAEFYNFTADDYQAVMSGWAKQRQSGAGPLKTQKLRDEDERQRAKQFGPVPVRVHLPDGMILQADFKALETIGALHRLVQQCVAANLPQWYMYVTPPKQVLKDLGLSFYKAGLLPAANVLIGVHGQLEGPFLKQHIAAMEGPAPVRQPTVSQADTSATTGGASKLAGDTDFMPSRAATNGKEKKTPKWMKLGK